MKLELLSAPAQKVVGCLLEENRVAFSVLWIARLCELRVEEAHTVMLELWESSFSGKQFAEEETPSPALLYRVNPVIFAQLRKARENALACGPPLKPYRRSRHSPLALRLG